MKKRLLSLLLALVLAASMAVPALAAEQIQVVKLADGETAVDYFPGWNYIVTKKSPRMFQNDYALIDLTTGERVWEQSNGWVNPRVYGDYLIEALDVWDNALLDRDLKPVDLKGVNEFYTFGGNYLIFFSEGKGLGVIDLKGNVIIPAKYDTVGTQVFPESMQQHPVTEGFHEGMAQVRLNDKIGFVNEKGQEVVPPTYHYAQVFIEGMAIVTDSADRKGAINTQGKVVVPLKHETLLSYSEGLAAADSNGKMGYLDKNGKFAIPAKYDLAFSFQNGLALVGMRNGGEWDSGYKGGYIDKTGKTVVTLKGYVDRDVRLSDGKYLEDRVSDEEMALYDLKGNLVVPYGKYRNIIDLPGGGRYSAHRKDGMWVLLDENFREISAPYNEFTARWHMDVGCWLLPVCRVGADGIALWGYINRQGEELIPPQYRKAGTFYEGRAGVTVVDEAGDWVTSVIDTTGTEVFRLKKGDGLPMEGFMNGLAETADGFRNRQGELVLPTKDLGFVYNYTTDNWSWDLSLLDGLGIWNRFANYNSHGEQGTPTAVWTALSGGAYFINPYFSANSLNAFARSRTYGGQFKDVADTAWYAGAVRTSYEYGLMDGSAGQFDPEGHLTVAQAITMASNVHEIYHTGKRNAKSGSGSAAWYQGYVDYALDNGIIKRGEFTQADYERDITRAEMAALFVRAVDPVELYQINKISAVPDVTKDTKNADEILTLYRAGALTGSEGGRFDPDKDISRAEAATILTCIILPERRRCFTL